MSRLWVRNSYWSRASLLTCGRDQHGETLDLGRQRDRTAHLSAGAPGGLDDFPRRLIDQPVIERLQANADALTGSCAHGAHSTILATTPAPTVRPPSRMAKRNPSSIAIGEIRLNPHPDVVARHHHLDALGQIDRAVTSVVRK